MLRLGTADRIPSTARQGRSGLGLEAQQAALARFAEAEGYSLIQTLYSSGKTEIAKQELQGITGSQGGLLAAGASGAETNPYLQGAFSRGADAGASLSIGVGSRRRSAR